MDQHGPAPLALDSAYKHKGWGFTFQHTHTPLTPPHSLSEESPPAKRRTPVYSPLKVVIQPPFKDPTDDKIYLVIPGSPDKINLVKTAPSGIKNEKIDGNRL